MITICRYSATYSREIFLHSEQSGKTCDGISSCHSTDTDDLRFLLTLNLSRRDITLNPYDICIRADEQDWRLQLFFVKNSDRYYPYAHIEVKVFASDSQIHISGFSRLNYVALIF